LRPDCPDQGGEAFGNPVRLIDPFVIRAEADHGLAGANDRWGALIDVKFELALKECEVIDCVSRVHFSDGARRKADEDESRLADSWMKAWIPLSGFAGIDAYAGCCGGRPQQGSAHAAIGANLYDQRWRTVSKNFRTAPGVSGNDAPNGKCH
jgi:hypothetical protein